MRSPWFLPLAGAFGVALGTFMGLLVAKANLQNQTTTVDVPLDAMAATAPQDANIADGGLPLDAAPAIDAPPPDASVDAKTSYLLKIVVEPESAAKRARVRVNGKKVKAPFHVELPIGKNGEASAKVRIRASRYRTYRKTYELTADQTLTIIMQGRRRRSSSGPTIDLP